MLKDRVIAKNCTECGKRRCVVNEFKEKKVTSCFEKCRANDKKLYRVKKTFTNLKKYLKQRKSDIMWLAYYQVEVVKAI